MYVIQFSTIPNKYIPEDHLQEYPTWLVNDNDRTRIPITKDAIVLHKLEIFSDNTSVDTTWNQMRLLNVFGYTLLPNICDSPETEGKEVGDEKNIEEVKAVDEVLDVKAVEGVEEVEEVKAVEGVEKVEEVKAVEGVEEVEEVKAVEGVEEVEYVKAVDGIDEVKAVEEVEEVKAVEGVEEVKAVDGVDEVQVVEEVREMQNEPIVTPVVTNHSDCIREMYNNDKIKNQYVKIYECIDKIKSNSAFIMDIKQEFSMMESKGIKVGAALPDLQVQYDGLITFEREALEEINKIDLLNRMINDQINTLEKRCIDMTNKFETTL